MACIMVCRHGVPQRRPFAPPASGAQIPKPESTFPSESPRTKFTKQRCRTHPSENKQRRFSRDLQLRMSKLKIPCGRFKTNDPKRMFPSVSSQTKGSMQQFVKKICQAKGSTRTTPSEHHKAQVTRHKKTKRNYPS